MEQSPRAFKALKWAAERSKFGKIFGGLEQIKNMGPLKHDMI